MVQALPRALGVALFAVVAACQACQGQEPAQPPDETLKGFAVQVARTPLPDWGAGGGVYLGNGLVLTAAHVVGPSWLTRPRVVIGTTSFTTRTVKEGRLETTDLALLAMDVEALPQRLRLRRLALCGGVALPGEAVISVTPEITVRSRILAPEQLPPDTRRFGTVMVNVAHSGNSGSGVFDAERRCLLGIVSRKITLPGPRSDHGRAAPRDIAKYFVPAEAIAAFLPPDVEIPVQPRATASSLPAQ